MASNHCEICDKHIEPDEPMTLVAVMGGFGHAHVSCIAELEKRRVAKNRLHAARYGMNPTTFKEELENFPDREDV